MNRFLDHLIVKKNQYRTFAPAIIASLLVMNTLLIVSTGGTPNAFAHTMYIPVIIAAFYFGPLSAMATGLAGGLLIGPFLSTELFDVATGPILHSFYRTLYFISIGGVVGLLFNFLQKRLTQIHLQSEELDATLMAIGDGVIITDEHGTIEKANPMACKLLGLSNEEVVNRPFSSVFHMTNHETQKKTKDPIEAVLSANRSIDLEENTVLNNHKDKRLFIEDSASPIHDQKGNLLGAVLVFRDITEKKKKEQKILHISYHDYLTGIPNRRHYHETLEKLNTSERYPLCLVMMDMNALKVINDAYGHEKGNTALKGVARALGSVKRPEDSIARIGGDEFAMVLPEADEAVVQDIKRKLNNFLSDFTVGGIEVSIAFGYAFKEDQTSEIHDVLRQAEDDMYKNKVLSSQSTRNNAILSILHTLTDKFQEERLHSKRVGQYCRLIGEKLGMRPDEVNELEFAGRLHDIGKISVPDSILKKPGPLSENEWALMIRHTVNGYQILRAADQFSNLAEYAMSHHERIDGKGYPNQLKGENIPLFARIIAVADAFEAMVSPRSYKDAKHEHEALEELKRHAGTQFDTKIVNLFIDDVYPMLDELSHTTDTLTH